MEITERDVERIIRRELERYFVDKKCPKCGRFTRMINAGAYDLDSDDDDWDGEYLKCLYCGAILREKLEEVFPSPDGNFTIPLPPGSFGDE